MHVVPLSIAFHSFCGGTQNNFKNRDSQNPNGEKTSQMLIDSQKNP
jgi:hypothetical protein